MVLEMTELNGREGISEATVENMRYNHWNERGKG